MRLKIDLEIPQWTKWLVAGIALGLVLGLGRGDAWPEKLKYANTQMGLNSSSTRPPYELLSHSCMHFMKDTASAGGTAMPMAVDPRPAGYIDRVRGSFPDLDFSIKGPVTIEGIKLK